MDTAQSDVTGVTPGSIREGLIRRRSDSYDAATLSYMTTEPNDALEVLREVWSAQGQDSAALDEACGESKGCKRMSDVGFDGMAGPDGDLRAAWKAQLEREGKLNAGTGSVRDLVLGPTTSR
jgi:hypothetical protein